MMRTCFFLILLFYLGPSYSQNSISLEKRGTIKVKKVKTNRELPKLIYKKKVGIRVFWGRFNASDYKITFPASYQSQLFPLVFNGSGLILADENKQWSDNTILAYDYEIFVGNTAEFMVKSVFSGDLNAPIRALNRGSYMWIKGLYYMDSKGVYHRDQIGEFKIEKVK